MFNLMLNNSESISETCQKLSYAREDNSSRDKRSIFQSHFVFLMLGLTNYYFPTTFHIFVTMSKHTWASWKNSSKRTSLFRSSWGFLRSYWRKNVSWIRRIRQNFSDWHEHWISFAHVLHFSFLGKALCSSKKCRAELGRIQIFKDYSSLASIYPLKCASIKIRQIDKDTGKEIIFLKKKCIAMPFAIPSLELPQLSYHDDERFYDADENLSSTA